MKCPKCGTANVAGEWVCARCEYVLDASFLGDDILNERTRDDGDLLPAAKLARQKSAVAADDFGGDALILGRLGDDDSNGESIVSGRTAAFLPVQSADIVEEAPAAVYVTGQLTALLSRQPVLRQAADAHDRQEVLSPFERAVFVLVDGQRSTEEIQQISGLSRNDLRVAVAMLLDKALVEATADAPADLEPHEDDGGGPVFEDSTQAIPDASSVDVSPTGQQVPVFLDDRTRELDDLPPLAEPSSPSGAPVEPLSPFDNLEMVPLPAAADPVPPTKPSRPRAIMAELPARPVAESADVRPAMALKPALQRTPAQPPAPVPPRVPAPPPSSAAPAPSSASTVEAKKRAAGYYELCMKDIHAGRIARAWGYAKMAADADPHEEKYQTLVRDWHKLSGGANPAQTGPTTPQEIMAAAQQAESSGDIPRAVELLEKLCAVAPDSAAAHNKLAVVLATRAKRFRPAYDAAFKAVELEPGNMAYQSNMMKILARLEADDRRDAPSADKGILGRLLKR